MQTHHHTYTTPAGPLTILTHGDTIVAAGFTADPRRLHGRLHTDRAHPLAPGESEVVSRAVTAWLDGDHRAFGGLTLDQHHTEFQAAVWAGLARIPAGTTASYREVADDVGRPAAVRAVGSACGANLIAPMVPCHRALRSDGSLGGYEYGLDVKRWLLDHEGVGRSEQPTLT